MVRIFRHGLFALWAAVVLAGVPAHAGIDQGYVKEEGKQNWGEIFSWAFGGEPLGKSYALVVGVSSYTGSGFKSLEATEADPERMRRFLIDQAGFDYVHVLTDEKVTQRRLRTLLLDEFRGRVGPGDQFLLYWSGHGVPVTNFAEQELGYLPLADSSSTSLASMLGMSEILGWTDLIGASQVLHVLDTSFSGLARLSETKSEPRDRTVELLAKPARHLLTATTGSGQTIAAREWSGSIFTDAFIEGAEGAADLSGDGVVDMLELEGFIRAKVNERRLRINWPSEIRPKSYDLQVNEGQFFFVTAEKKREVAQVDENPPGNVQCEAEADRLFWETIKDKPEAAYFEAYLERVEAGELCGRFAALARIEIEKLEREPPAVPDNPPAVIPRQRVILIQAMLAELSFNPGTIDGEMGARTKAAVMAFQRSINVPVTGIMSEEDELALVQAFVDYRAEQELASATGHKGRTLPDHRDAIQSDVLTELLTPAELRPDELFIRDRSDKHEPSSGTLSSQAKVFHGSYALIVGVSSYSAAWPQLDAAKNDPLRMREYLIENSRFDVVITLTNERATKDRIQYLMQDVFPEILGAHDRLLFYFSGHGTQRVIGKTKQGYLPLTS